MFHDIQEFQPTAIILPFMAIKLANCMGDEMDSLDMVKLVNNLNETTNLDGMTRFIGADIVNLLRTRKPCLWQKKGLVVTNKKCLIF